LFPRVPDYHKPNKPLIPNGLGVVYVIVSTVYLFLIHFFGVVKASSGASLPLTLAVCILFGGFLGLLDDWMDLKWRYKAFLPLIAAIPLISLASRLEPPARTAIAIPLLGTIDFGPSYYFIIVPLLVMIITNTVNQLGGLNGLETLCPAIVMIGLMTISGSSAILLICPLLVWLLLSSMNLAGKIFVGNTGSFAIGITLVAFAIISDTKFDLVFSVLPYIINSALILLTYFFYKTKANASFDGEKLSSDHRRSLITLLTYRRRLTERQAVLAISLLVAASTALALLLHWTRVYM
jgi:UDP-N-acetylglucosamine--dolichyl-phosphate N-acetylglucosaminephosphotransferase